MTQAFLNFITHHEVPKMLIFDNGTELKNSIIKDLTTLHKINVHYITSLHPNSNETIEIFHSTVVEHIRILNQTRKELSIMNQMSYAILGYNYSIHSTTKYRPIDVINGHLDLIDHYNLDTNKILYSNYIDEHKNKMLKIYKHLNADISRRTDNTINNINTSRKEPLSYKLNILSYHKTQTRNNISPHFKPHLVVQNQNTKIRTPRNTYHKNNFKRPLTNQKPIIF